MQKPKLSNPNNLLINGQRQNHLAIKKKLKQTGKRLELVMHEAQRKQGIKI